MITHFHVEGRKKIGLFFPKIRAPPQKIMTTPLVLPCTVSRTVAYCYSALVSSEAYRYSAYHIRVWPRTQPGNAAVRAHARGYVRLQ